MTGQHKITKLYPHTIRVSGDPNMGVLDVYFEDNRLTRVNLTVDLCHSLIHQLKAKLEK